MVFEIVNNLLLICLIIINYRIIKKLNIILIKPKPLAPLVEDIMSCDNCDSCDNYDNYDNCNNYNNYNFVEKSNTIKINNHNTKGPPKPLRPPPSLPYPLQSQSQSQSQSQFQSPLQSSILHLQPSSLTDQISNCDGK